MPKTIKAPSEGSVLKMRRPIQNLALDRKTESVYSDLITYFGLLWSSFQMKAEDLTFLVKDCRE